MTPKKHDQMAEELGKFMADPSEGGTRSPNGFTKQECFEAGFRACHRVMFSEQVQIGEDIREIERLRMEQNLRKNTLIREYRKQSNLYAWLVSRLSMADLDIMHRRPLGSKEEVEEVLAEIKKICN